MSLQAKLEKMQADCARVSGQPFNYFLCPILFTDENVELCQAHIVNKTIPNSTRQWTVQRKDVDNFYGSYFEAEFVEFIAILEAENGYIENVIADRALRKKFNPQILVDDKPVNYFVSYEKIPDEFTLVRFEDDKETIDLGLKLPREEFIRLAEHTWEISAGNDYQIPALVSLIKAAHLTLFEMFGYSYARSYGARFVGYDILGQFFLQNRGKSKPEVISNARVFFSDYTAMVCPVEVENLNGTISDSVFYACIADADTWAIIILIRASKSMYAVVVPYSTKPDAVARFVKFLQGKYRYIEAIPCGLENRNLGEPIKLAWNSKQFS